MQRNGWLLAGALALSAFSCRAPDPRVERAVEQGIERMQYDHTFPRRNAREPINYQTLAFPYYRSERLREAVARDLEHLLQGYDWSDTIKYCAEYDVSLDASVQKVIQNPDAFFYRKGNVFRFLEQCSQAGYDLRCEKEWSQIFTEIIRKTHDLRKTSKTIIGEIRDSYAFLKDQERAAVIESWLPVLLERGDLDEAWSMVQENKAVRLRAEQSAALAFYASGAPVHCGEQVKQYEFNCAGSAGQFLTRESFHEDPARATKAFLSHYFQALSEVCFEHPEIDFVQHTLREFDALRLAHDEKTSNIVLGQVAGRCDRFLEPFLEAGFQPSPENVLEYCTSGLKVGMSLADAELYQSRGGKGLNAQHFSAYALHRLRRKRGDPQSPLLAVRALEDAKTVDPVFVVPHEVAREYHERKWNLDLDITSVRALAKAAGEDFWKSNVYQKRLELLSQAKPAGWLNDPQVAYGVELLQLTRMAFAEGVPEAKDLYTLFTSKLSVLTDKKQGLFLEMIRKSPQSERAFRFAGDIEFERGNKVIAYEFWSQAGYSDGIAAISGRRTLLAKE